MLFCWSFNHKVSFTAADTCYRNLCCFFLFRPIYVTPVVWIYSCRPLFDIYALSFFSILVCFLCSLKVTFSLHLQKPSRQERKLMSYMMLWGKKDTCMIYKVIYLYVEEWQHTLDKPSRLQGLCLMVVSSNPCDTWNKNHNHSSMRKYL